MKPWIVRHGTLIAVAALILVGFAIYANSFGNQMFWDDFDGIVNNVYVHNFSVGDFFTKNLIAGSGLESNYWRPVLLITYSIEWHLWGNWVGGYHLTNTLLHIGDAILLFFILSALFKKKLVPFATALFFLAPPLQTEAITYVSGRGDPLSFFFTLLAVFFYIRMHEGKSESRTASYWYLAAFLMYPLALMTKERSIILPGFLLLVDIWYAFALKTKWKEAVREIAMRLAPFAVLGIGFLILRGTLLNFQNTFNIYNTHTYYTDHVAARFFTFLSTLPVYVGLMLFPTGLHMERSLSFPIATTFFNPQVILGFVIAALLIAVSALFWKKDKRIAFGAAWFFVAIFPASGIAVPVAGLIYEHYMYAPIVGFFIFLAALVALIPKNLRALQYALISLGGVGIIFFGMQTIRRNADWRDPVTFYTQTLHYEPKSVRIWNNLGIAYADAGNLNFAKDAYEHTIVLDPANAIPHYDLGNVYEEEGDMKDAVAEWQRSITLDPTFIFPYQKLYNYYLSIHDSASAQKILSALPKNAN